MKVVVCVKHVPTATPDRRFDDDGTVDRAGIDGLLSELDEYAVEQALRIKEQQPDVTVTVLTVGPEAALDAARKALQMGADDAVHVQDEAIAGSDAPATSKVLAAALTDLAESGPIDLIVTGMASTDGGLSVVPIMLAERLNLPALTLAETVDLAGGTVTVRREGDRGTETLEAQLPLVLSVSDRIGEARYPSFKGIMAAKKKKTRTLTAADLSLSPGDIGIAGSRARVVGAEAKPPRTRGAVAVDDGDGTAGAQALVGFLAAHTLA